jgi:transcription elongation factor Elf1
MTITYRCPKCGAEKRFQMSALDQQGMRIVTCGECTDDDGWRTVMVPPTPTLADAP